MQSCIGSQFVLILEGLGQVLRGCAFQITEFTGTVSHLQLKLLYAGKPYTRLKSERGLIMTGVHGEK